jgi:hypothetical protein
MVHQRFFPRGFEPVKSSRPTRMAVTKPDSGNSSFFANQASISQAEGVSDELAR